jgi:hypothetical protein
VYSTRFTTVITSGTSGTSVFTNNDLSRTDWNINNGGGLDNWFWWNTHWWVDQVTGTSDTVIWMIDTGFTEFEVTIGANGFISIISSVWTVTSWRIDSVFSTNQTIEVIRNTSFTSKSTNITVFTISFEISIRTDTGIS